MKKILKMLVFLPFISMANNIELKEYTNGFFDSGAKGIIVKNSSKYNGNNFNYYSYKTTDNSNSDLYVFFHGENAKSKEFFDTTGLHNTLKKNGSFISINSPKEHWYSDENSVRDIKYFSLHLIREYINALRFRNVYLIGYSSGGTLVNELMCDYRFSFVKGVANIGGSIHGKNLEQCNLDKKLFPYLFVYGDMNEFYGYKNKDLQNSSKLLPPNNSKTLFDAELKLSNILRCNNPAESWLSDTDIEDNSSIVKREYVCEQGKRNIFRVLMVKNFSKNWLGNHETANDDFNGNSNRDILFNSYIIDFLKFNEM